MKIQYNFLLLIVIILGLSSCRSLYPTLMFKDAEQNVNLGDFVNSNYIKDYKINVGDRITMQIFTNDGYQLINALTEENQATNRQQQQPTYLVDNDGYVKLPVIDTIKVIGLTIRGTEKLLEHKYATYYKDPYVTITVTNRRVYYILGQGGAQVIEIDRENPSIIEVIAKAGGLGTNNKAYKIKIIRGDLNDPEIRVIDLREIESMKQSELYVLANDIIYVEPANKFNTGLARALAPYATVLGIITSSLGLYFILTR